MSFNVTIPENKLVSFDALTTSTYANSYVIGRSLNIVKTYELLGVDPSTGVYTFTDFNKDGIISEPQDQQNLVDPSQRYYGGMQHAVTWKKWTFSCLFQFARQPYTESFVVLMPRPGTNGNQSVAILNRWTSPGDITDIQRLTVSNSAVNSAYAKYQFSQAAYSNGSFIRLRNLFIEYDLLPSTMKKWGLAKCSLFIQGHNLFTITQYEGLDPETRTFLPPLRMITTGIQINL
jgi:hypothetical protein